jgi:hypothetical protein
MHSVQVFFWSSTGLGWQMSECRCRRLFSGCLCPPMCIASQCCACAHLFCCYNRNVSEKLNNCFFQLMPFYKIYLLVPSKRVMSSPFLPSWLFFSKIREGNLKKKIFRRHSKKSGLDDGKAFFWLCHHLGLFFKKKCWGDEITRTAGNFVTPLELPLFYANFKCLRVISSPGHVFKKF